MKKITKILSIALILLFIVIPTLKNQTGKGGVKAARLSTRTMTTVVYNVSEIDKPLGAAYISTNKEVAVKQSVEYCYKVKFSSQVNFNEIATSELNQFKNGSVLTANCTDTGIYADQINMKLSNVKLTKQSNGRYTVTATISSDNYINTKYNTIKNITPIALINWSGYYPQKIYIKYSEKVFNSAKITWLIYPKDYADNTYTTININDDARRLYIRNLYKKVLNREPSSTEISTQMARNIQTNATDIILGTESNNVNHTNSMTNEQFVKFIYEAILCRDADSVGLSESLSLLNNGVQRKIIVKMLVESVEFREYWNKNVKTLTFDAATCTAVFSYLSQNNFHILKASNTTIKMFEYSINNVKKIDVSGKGVTNLNGMSQFPNLETLISNNNKLTNISEVSKLSNVKVLYLNNCGLGSIDNSPIKSMKKIEELHVDNNTITSRTFKFSGTPTIKKLYMNGNQIVTISETLLTNNLRELYMDNNQVTNTEEVDYSNLTKISLKNNKNGMNSRGVYKIIPQIVKDAQNKSSKLYATSGLVFNKCKIEGNSVVMNAGAAAATITIKGGAADGTVITFKNLDVAQ